MANETFEPFGSERGVLAIEAINPLDWPGMAVDSFTSTNSAEIRSESSRLSTLSLDIGGTLPIHDVSETLCEAVDRYDNLLRRLSD